MGEIKICKFWNFFEIFFRERQGLYYAKIYMTYFKNIFIIMQILYNDFSQFYFFQNLFFPAQIWPCFRARLPFSWPFCTCIMSTLNWDRMWDQMKHQACSLVPVPTLIMEVIKHFFKLKFFSNQFLCKFYYNIYKCKFFQ